MPFSFGGPQFPMSLKWTKSLLYTEAVVFFWIVAFSFLEITLLNSSGTGTQIDTAWAPSVAIPLFLVLGGLCVYLAMSLSKQQGWTRLVIVILQTILFVVVVIDSVQNGVNV